MNWSAVDDATLRKNFVDDDMSFKAIADLYGATRGQVAGRVHRLGLKRAKLGLVSKNKPGPKRKLSAAEIAERAVDQRDIDILYDLAEGHAVKDAAKHWGVETDYVETLIKEAAA